MKIEAKNKRDETVLSQRIMHYFAFRNEELKTQAIHLLEKGALPDQVVSKYDLSTLLHMVVRSQFTDENPMVFEYLDLLNALIKAGVNLEAKTADGDTALFYADTLNEVTLLVQANANVTAENYHDLTPEDSFRIKKTELKELQTSLIKELDETKKLYEQNRLNSYLVQIAQLENELNSVVERIIENDKILNFLAQ